MIIHSVQNNNTRSLSCTADLSPISIPLTDIQHHSTCAFGKVLDCASVVTATHTICYVQDEMACHLHPILLHLGCNYYLHSSHCFLSTWGAVMLINNGTASAFPGPCPNPNLISNPSQFSQQATTDDQCTVQSNVPNDSTTGYKYVHNGL